MKVEYKMTKMEKLLVFLNREGLKEEFFKHQKHCGWNNSSIDELVEVSPIYAIIGNAFPWHSYGGNEKWQKVSEDWQQFLKELENN